MALLRFRVYWEDDDQIYRDIEIKGTQTFLEFHKGILAAYEFDGKHTASFFESNERWQPGREISSEVLANKKDAPALSMARTPISALVAKPDQKFLYIYDPAKKWSFLIELIGVTKDEDFKRSYPYTIRKEGIAPGQYGIKGLNSKLVEHDTTDDKYDLGAEEMAEGFTSEGDEGGGGGEALESGDENQSLGLD